MMIGVVVLLMSVLLKYGSPKFTTSPTLLVHKIFEHHNLGGKWSELDYKSNRAMYFISFVIINYILSCDFGSGFLSLYLIFRRALVINFIFNSMKNAN